MTAKVKFVSETEVKEGKTLLEASKDSKVKLKDSCDGKGKCGKCLVKVVSGNLTKPSKKEVSVLGKKKIEQGYRLACQTEVIDGDAVIEVIHGA